MSACQLVSTSDLPEDEDGVQDGDWEDEEDARGGSEVVDGAYVGHDVEGRRRDHGVVVQCAQTKTTRVQVESTLLSFSV